MSSGQVKVETSTDYRELLYSDEEEDCQVKSDGSDLEDDDSRPTTPEAPPYSPLSSPLRESYPLHTSSPSTSHQEYRERSPLRTPEPEVVIEILDEFGAPLVFGTEKEESFLFADAHDIFMLSQTEENGGRGGTEERSGRRGGRRGGLRGYRDRGRGRRGLRHTTVRRRRQGNEWDVGHPLNQIWLSDQDVPAEFAELLGNVMIGRAIGMQEGGDRNGENDDDDEFCDTVAEFTWSPMNSFTGKEEDFIPKRTGAAQIYNSAYDAFRSYWDDDIIGLIVTKTNQYAARISASHFKSNWDPTNNAEILCLFAFWMMLGIVRMPTITSCFSNHPLLQTEIFKRIFSRQRYCFLTRALYFIDSDPDIPQNDKLFHIRPILDHLNSKFQQNYILSKDICIDESLTLWKGRLDIKQYIRSKASKFGIKTFELCESTTGYLWSFIVYTGKQTSVELAQAAGVLKSTAIVKKLIAPLLHKGYRLFMDNWYNSPLLARFLKRNGTDCVGTLRPTRRDVPYIVNMAPLKRGEIIARNSGDVTVLSWQDKKRVTMISTCHGSSVALPTVSSRVKSRPIPFKPQVVLDYNKYMGGVDLKDQMLEPYLLERKRCHNWYMKLFKRLLNVSILNSRILVQSSTCQHQDHLAFRLQLVDAILLNHLSLCPQSRKRHSTFSSHPNPVRRVPYVHWPILLKNENANSSDQKRKRCVVCLREGRKSIKTNYCCETCLVPLCIRDCFKSYHTS